MVRHMSPQTVAPSRGSAARYRIDDIIGHGAMGIIAAVRDQQSGERYAMKFLRSHFAQDADVVERFQREIQAARSLRSEHAVHVIDHGIRPDGTPFMVMEYLDGHDLEQELAERGRLPVAEAVSYVTQACRALAEAHASGLVHRDLKPSNLYLVKKPNGERLVKVLDFGVSKSRSARRAQFALTQVKAVLGSPAYIAPEQARCARDVDERADIWSLGVILYQSLTGRLPFAGDSIGELFASIQCGKFTPVRQLCPSFPPDLARAIERCLRARPEERFGSVMELADALVPWTPNVSSLGDKTAEQENAVSLRPLVMDRVARPEKRGMSSVATAASWTKQLWRRCERYWPLSMVGLLLVGFAAGAALAPAQSARSLNAVPSARSAYGASLMSPSCQPANVSSVPARASASALFGPPGSARAVCGDGERGREEPAATPPSVHARPGADAPVLVP